ncbi:MAG: GtrA family protein [Caldilinea sp. CFX5]|nr:GtrA family protein [Caldilinea sp. CFX5]
MKNPLPELKRFIKFGIVGSIGAAIHLSVLNLAMLMLSYGFALGVKGAAQLSNPIAFACAVVSNFFLNRFWTFPESQQYDIRKQFFTYALINLVGLGINQMVFIMMTNWIAPRVITNPLFAANASLLVAIAIVFLWNYGANRRITYAALSTRA